MSGISILMATHNGGQFVASQLESLAIQSKLPSELIVSDDCSKDDTVSIVQSFIKHSPFPVYIYRNQYNKGFRQNFIDAMTLCSSHLIAFCDQDDVWHKDKLLLTSDRFTDKSILLVHHNARIVDSAGNFIASLWPNTSLSHSGDLLMAGPWAFSLGFTQVFRRDLVWFQYLWEQSIDPNWPTERLAHDQWVFFLSSVFGKIVYVDQELADYRQHDNNLYGIGWMEECKKKKQRLEEAGALVEQQNDVYGVRWGLSVVGGEKKKKEGNLSWFKSLRYILNEDGKRFYTLANIANNRVDILSKVAKDKVYLSIIRQQATAGLSQYSALAERLSLRAQIYQRAGLTNRLVAWLKLMYVRAYRFDPLWWFSVKAAVSDALVGVVLGPRVLRLVKSSFYKFRSLRFGSAGILGSSSLGVCSDRSRKVTPQETLGKSGDR